MHGVAYVSKPDELQRVTDAATRAFGGFGS